MKKKGFTLVEIIISIGLILLIGTVSIVSFNVVKKNNKIKTLNYMSEDIYNAVNLYVETNVEIKNELYKNNNGIKIPLTTLENAGLVDFEDVELDEDDYVITMLGSKEEDDDHCASTYTAKSWEIKSGEVIYICEKTNSDLESLKEELNALKEKVDAFTGGSNEKSSLKLETLYADLTYTAKGENPNNYVYFEVESNSSKLSYFPSGAKQNLWRIISIDTDGKIKLIYSQPVKSNNFSNYTTSSSTWCDYGLKDLSSCTYYKLKHASEGSSYYYRYNSDDGYVATEILEDVTVSGSKKEALYNAIKNKNWIVANKYFSGYTISSSGTDLKLDTSKTVNLKMGMINPNEVNSSINISDSWLYKYYTLVGSLDKSVSFENYYLYVYVANGNLDFGNRKYKASRCTNSSCSKDKDSSSHWDLRTYSYYPVITLDSKVDLVETTCENGNVKGSENCPYKLKCDSCA